MVLRPQIRLGSILRGMTLASLLVTGVACVTTDDRTALTVLDKKPDEPIRLPDAEQMIDELDRAMTAYGTISVKSPDVWGQDRLAKFRSEYESQMSGWLKQGYKSEINGSVRHTESEATRLMLGANAIAPPPPTPTSNSTSTSTPPAPAPTPPSSVSLQSLLNSTAALNPGLTAAPGPPDKTPVALEPTVVLDEHSNYLNHLNQLRRINAGDDLTDRPGYGLYLIRIPVTLSPGPRSRRGKGAIITVSAKSIMTKHTLRDALRNAVINETVTSLTQAIVNGSGSSADQDPGRGAGTFSLLSFADTELYHGAENIALLKHDAERQLAGELLDEPHHKSARIAEWLRGELQSSYHLLEEAATPVRTAQLADAIDPLEELGDLILKRDFPANCPGAAGPGPRHARPPDRRRKQRRTATSRSSSANES